MGYLRADKILPIEIIELIQEYVDGENIYIPRKESNKKEWGSETQIRQVLEERNLLILHDFRKGMSLSELAAKYFLSKKSIQRIIREMKKNS